MNAQKPGLVCLSANSGGTAMPYPTFSSSYRLFARVAKFVIWQVLLSALVLGLSSSPAVAADDTPQPGDHALITNAELGSYVVSSHPETPAFRVRVG